MDGIPAKHPEPRPPAPSLKGEGRIASESLFGSRREIVILHNDREYRLRLTQNGKLILTA